AGCASTAARCTSACSCAASTGPAGVRHVSDVPHAAAQQDRDERSAHSNHLHQRVAASGPCLSRDKKHRPAATPLMRLLLLLLVPAVPAAASPATCSQTDVQAAIDAAASGDTILVPAGSCTWSNVTIPGSKGLTLQGGSGGTTTIAGSEALSVTTHATTTTRVTGFTFTGVGTSNGGDVVFN